MSNATIWSWWNRLTEKEQEILLEVLYNLDFEDYGIDCSSDEYCKKEGK